MPTGISPPDVRQHLARALAYGNQGFIQLLEGERAILEEAYARISQDPQHQHSCMIAYYASTDRSFAGCPLYWLVSFCLLNS